MESNVRKIMYVLGSLADRGGIERVLIDKMNYIVNHGYQVTVVTYQQGNHPFSFELSPQVKHLDTGTRFYTLYKYGLIKRIFARHKLKKKYKCCLQEIVNQERPDIIIITTYDLPICGCVTKLNTSAKLLVEAHIPMAETIEGNIHSRFFIRRLIDKVFNLYQCRKVGDFDLLITLTNRSVKEWKRFTKNIVVIPNPVTYYPDNISPKPISSKRIIAVGRLHPQKGFDILINAFGLISNQCPDWKLDIYGDGDDKEMLNCMISDRKLQDRIFIHEPTNNIYGEYLSSDFYVLSSRYEGFGLVLIEALSCGLPCVSFNCDYGPSEIIVNNECGILIPVGNTQELADKILFMCKHDDIRLKMGQSAREISKKFKKEEIMPCWIDLFNNLSVY